MTDLRHFQHGNLPEVFGQMLIDVHADAYADQMDDPFHQRFAWFVDHWTGMDGFSCVVAYDGDEPVGFAYGAPLASGREWWRSTAYEPNNGSSSTYAVSEVMVRPSWRKQELPTACTRRYSRNVRKTSPCCWSTSRTPRSKPCTKHGDTPESASSNRSPTHRCTRSWSKTFGTE